MMIVFNKLREKSKLRFWHYITPNCQIQHMYNNLKILRKKSVQQHMNLYNINNT